MPNIHSLYRKSILRMPLKEAWAFFSNPKNLPEITPPDLNFKLTCSAPEVMYPGLIISYRVSPFCGIPVTWVTEITHIIEGSYFVDEQRVGPYRMWHHEHHFRAHEDGVEMIDQVHYVLPFGILGEAVHRLLVRSRVEEIFNFREKALVERFS